MAAIGGSNEGTGALPDLAEMRWWRGTSAEDEEDEEEEEEEEEAYPIDLVFDRGG